MLQIYRTESPKQRRHVRQYLCVPSVDLDDFAKD